ncbi:hypothetical protein [Nonomuraea cavernae]|uniref:Uncharacterized protein n=1 Tax=Nonomuraea cavernae TaxID=2045107 RepID=A0A917YP93_9ACTN|nr:hypothetical protein [Nonomuraea cavernae]MCA2183939.1 hypothetical protein [Nonomuraea cavernae]GGO61831.1 hypothetical protein GCM10012289_05000 [Nonomuraea cavernae]
METSPVGKLWVTNAVRLGLDHGEVRILNLGDELVITNTALPDALEAALR